MKEGRTERRMDVIMAGRLSSAATVQHTEWVSIRNISVHGAQVLCDRRWETHHRVSLGEPVGDQYLDAEVIYCRPGPDNRYAVGLKFVNVTHRYGGTARLPSQTHKSFSEADAR